MTSPTRADLRVNVLNPGGRDPNQDFGNDAQINSNAHAPVNFHAYAACTGGMFLREVDAAIAAGQPVLLLLRGDFRTAEKAMAALKKMQIPVAVSLKETGLHQIAEQLDDPRRLQRFTRLVQEADGCLASTPEAAEIYRSVRQSEAGVAFVPTPYPIEDPHWNGSRAVEERRGIFIGTREWDVPSRNHFAALALAAELSHLTGEPITVYDFAGRKGARLMNLIGFPARKLHLLTERRGYPHYLRVMGEHRIILQLDSSFVPGQVAGDALLCRVPCVGGNGAIDRLGHPLTCGWNRTIGELREIALQLLHEPQAVEPPSALSFSAGALALRDYFDSLR